MDICFLFDEISPWMTIRAILDESFEQLEIRTRHSFWEGHDLGHVDWNDHLVDLYIRIGGDHSAP